MPDEGHASRMAARNVVLVCLDAVRKDVFDECAPELRSLADVEFGQCRAASTWSVPSHASLFTGELPHVHGNHSRSIAFDALPARGTFLDDLPEHTRYGASANPYANSYFGFDRLFDEFADIYEGVRYPEALDVRTFYRSTDAEGPAAYAAFLRAALGHDHPVRSLFNGGFTACKRWLDRSDLAVPTPFDDGAAALARHALRTASEEPFVLFLNAMEAHQPLRDALHFDREAYDVPRGYTSADVDFVANRRAGDSDPDVRYTRELYDAAVGYLDRVVAEFVRELRAATDLPTTVCVTADHGENLAYPAEDRQWGHVYCDRITEGLAHVPLAIVNPPDGFDPDEDRFVSHLWLGELLAAFGRGAVPSVPDRPVAVETLGMGTIDRSHQEDNAGHLDLDAWDRKMRCVYEDGVKTHWWASGEVARHEVDGASSEVPLEGPDDRTPPGEAGGPDRYRELFERPLSAVDLEAGTPTAVDEQVRERLAELGYR